MKRTIHIGNTEEHYHFCPEEILYAETVKGEEKFKVHLLNGNSYDVPCLLNEWARTTDNSLMKSDQKMIRLGRFYVVNNEYVKSAENGIVTLSADIEVKNRTEIKIKISPKACATLQYLIGKDYRSLLDFQHENHSDGYNKQISGDGRYTSFMIVRYVPKERDDAYYDIDDDDILILGI